MTEYQINKNSKKLEFHEIYRSHISVKIPIWVIILAEVVLAMDNLVRLVFLKLTIFFDSPLWWPFTFAARSRHSWLLPKATTSLKSQKPIFAAGGRHIFLWPEATRLSKSHVPTKIGTMVTMGSSKVEILEHIYWLRTWFWQLIY